MKNKKLALVALTAGLSVLSCIPAFASGWQKDTVGWWYAVSEDNTDWYESGWVWIDGNLDGVAERYYFNPDGYVAVNTTVNGKQVDGSGAWVENGVVQVRTEANGDKFDGMSRKNDRDSLSSDLNHDKKITGEEYLYYVTAITSGNISIYDPEMATTSETRKQNEQNKALAEKYANEPDEPVDLDKMQREIDEWTYQEAIKRMGGQQ